MALHNPFHLVYGMVKDILHCGYLGVVKALLVNDWFSTTNRDKDYNIVDKVIDPWSDRLLYSLLLTHLYPLCTPLTHPLHTPLVNTLHLVHTPSLRTLPHTLPYTPSTYTLSIQTPSHTPCTHTTCKNTLHLVHTLPHTPLVHPLHTPLVHPLHTSLVHIPLVHTTLCMHNPSHTY